MDEQRIEAAIELLFNYAVSERVRLSEYSTDIRADKIGHLNYCVEVLALLLAHTDDSSTFDGMVYALWEEIVYYDDELIEW